MCELLRQREMLERSVATLRAQAEKQSRAHKDRVATLVKVSIITLTHWKFVKCYSYLSCPSLSLSFSLSSLQENSELLARVRELEDRAWRLEEETRQAESLAGLRDPRSCRRKASRDQLVQTLTRQADTIARLQLQLKEGLTVRMDEER